jgi:hypothetical protein
MTPLVPTREELPNGDLKFTLPDGDWVVFTTEPEHGRFNRFYKAYMAAIGATDAAFDLVAETILAMGTESRLTDREGHEQPLTADGIASVPERKLYAFFRAFQPEAKALLGALAPND